MELKIPSSTQRITYAGRDYFIKRDDLIHPHISGNKWRKLEHNVLAMRQLGLSTMLTFGGSFSNHIAAVASAGKEMGFNTIGIIRGGPYETLNPTLKLAAKWGMKLRYWTREDYKEKKASYSEEGVFVVPEGGANEAGVKGCEAIVTELEQEYDYICLAGGTGTTAAGVIRANKSRAKVLVFPALKGGQFLQPDIENYLSGSEKFKIITPYHFGGYAKVTNELIAFIRGFYKQTRIKLDPVYTGKMAFGVTDMVAKGEIAADAKILLLHTGGLQGIPGMEDRLGYPIFQ